MTGRIAQIGIAAAAALALAAPAAAYDREREQRNYEKLGERFQQEQATAEYQSRHLETSAGNLASLIARDVEERGDRFSGSLCASGVLICNRDHRLDDWESYGVRRPVVFVNRNGAHVEGGVWASNATVAAGARVPAVVIETGSVQAPENWYRWAAQVLAAHGYVVLTFDVQGQGRSDLLGHGPETLRGVPAQDGEHFIESLQDALDFALSSADAPYLPRDPDAAARQEGEVADGDAAPHNPLAALVDTTRVGIVGHSLGAFAVSGLQARDDRVDAIVAWDNLRTGRSGETTQPVEGGEFEVRVPALGMSADYGLVPTPKGSDPDPDERNAGFRHWRGRRDAMQVNIRGGAHYEWSYSPSLAFVPPATLRGIDVAAWYTTAWLDRYVKDDPSAVDRLLTTRWHADPVDAAIDPPERGNLFSFYYRSPVSIHRPDGTPVECADLRDGCGGALAADGEPLDPPYSYLEDRKRGR